MIYDYFNYRDKYSAPFIGNGSIALQIGPDGSMNSVSAESKISSYPSKCVWWAGRRYVGEQTKPLIPFGRFFDDLNEKPISAKQELDVISAEVVCETEYPKGKVKTFAFVDTNENLIVIKKDILPESELDYSFTYCLCQKDNEKCCPELMNVSAETFENGGKLNFEMTDRVNYRGVINIVCDSDVITEKNSNSVKLSIKAKKAVSIIFYVLFADNIDYEDLDSFSYSAIQKSLSKGYSLLKERHGIVWKKYYDEGYAYTGNLNIDKAYLTSQYHMKCFSTKWSLPVGLYDTAWDGRYFGFDEHYIMLGLLTSNHFNDAKKVPMFRKTGLSHAISRSSSKDRNAAHYPWETLEDGTEASPYGWWNGHIFHMGTIPLSGWEYYLYSADIDFLRDIAYPMLDSCAEFFRVHAIYRIDGGKLVIGRCTDLERLGSDVINPYMTTCGAIAVLKAFAKASRILNVNIDLADECDSISSELIEYLPNDGKKYIPCHGCNDRSIGVLSGTFPFDVISRDSELQKNAIFDFLDHEQTYGNMYPFGKGVCSWYACWKSIVFTRLGYPEKATEAIQYVAGTVGDFGEVFEISEKESGLYLRPWFTTAAGMFVRSVNEALLSYDENDNLSLLSGLDQSFKNISFKLPAKGGITIELVLNNDKITKLVAYGNKHCKINKLKVSLPSRFGGNRELEIIFDKNLEVS